MISIKAKTTINIQEINNQKIQDLFIIINFSIQSFSSSSTIFVSAATSKELNSFS